MDQLVSFCIIFDCVFCNDSIVIFGLQNHVFNLISK